MATVSGLVLLAAGEGRAKGKKYVDGVLVPIDTPDPDWGDARTFAAREGANAGAA